MFTKKTKSVSDEHLDRVGKALVQALRQHDGAAEEAGSAPASFAQLKARIAQEKSRREQTTIFSIWEAIVALAGQSLPTFSLVTAGAVFFVWVLPAQNLPAPTGTAPVPVRPEEQLVQLTPMRECTISTKPDCSVSPSDVLAIVVRPAK